MGVATSKRSSLPTIARNGVRARRPRVPPAEPSNENEPRGRDDMSSEFTGTNTRTSTASSTAPASSDTPANSANDSMSPDAMPSAAQAAGGNKPAICVTASVPKAASAAASPDCPDNANEPAKMASTATSDSTTMTMFACRKREENAAMSAASTMAAAKGTSGANTMDSAMSTTDSAPAPACDAYTANAGTMTSSPNTTLMAYSDAMRDSTTDSVGTGNDMTRS